MSLQLISHSRDLQRLVDEGYSVSVRSGHLVVDRVPYLNSQGELCFGMLVSELTLAGEITAKPDSHVALFSGEHPCGTDGQRLLKIAHQSDTKDLGDGLVVHHSFSSKPADGYTDYHHKMVAYYGLVSASAVSKCPDECQRRAVVSHVVEDDGIFVYMDTASSRVGINRITNKLRLDRIAIVGLGGTGAYVLDLVAKTPVKEVHLYDGDDFLQHNAFRSPGAASLDQLRKKQSKVDYYAATYSSMRNGLVPHHVYLTESNVDELGAMDFVFVCIDNAAARKLIFERLVGFGISFVDVGMGVVAADDFLLGIVRQTSFSPEKNDHAKRLPLSVIANDGPYATNIQIADLNALNATLAVIKWKKMCGFYLDIDREHHSTYTIDGNMLLNEERHAISPESDSPVCRVRAG